MAKYAGTCRLSTLLPFLSIFLSAFFLTSAIPSGAKDAAKTSAQQPQLAPEPSLGPKPPSDTKGGEGISTANAFAILAQQAADNNETVKRIETFYSNTVTLFLSIITAFTAFVGIGGFVWVHTIAKKTAKQRAEKELAPHLSNYETMKINYETMKSEFELMKTELNNFKKIAERNLNGLRSATLAWFRLVDYVENIGKENAWMRREESRQLVREVLEQIKPDDKIVLSLAHSVYGLILFFDENYETALDILRRAVEEDNTNSPAAYNLACCACNLVIELDNKGGDPLGRVTSLEDEALTSLEHVLRLNPWRTTEVRNDPDFQRLRKHPRFKMLTGASDSADHAPPLTAK